MKVTILCLKCLKETPHDIEPYISVIYQKIICECGSKNFNWQKTKKIVDM